MPVKTPPFPRRTFFFLIQQLTNHAIQEAKRHKFEEFTLYENITFIKRQRGCRHDIREGSLGVT